MGDRKQSVGYCGHLQLVGSGGRWAVGVWAVIGADPDGDYCVRVDFACELGEAVAWVALVHSDIWKVAEVFPGEEASLSTYHTVVVAVALICWPWVDLVVEVLVYDETMVVAWTDDPVV